VSGKIAAIMERLRSDYRCNVAGRLRGYRGAQRLGDHGVDRVPGTPAVDQGAERLDQPLINRSVCLDNWGKYPLSSIKIPLYENDF